MLVWFHFDPFYLAFSQKKGTLGFRVGFPILCPCIPYCVHIITYCVHVSLTVSIQKNSATVILKESAFVVQEMQNVLSVVCRTSEHTRDLSTISDLYED